MRILLFLLALFGPPVKQTVHYVPRVVPFGDSITHGVGSQTTTAGWKSGVYLSAVAAGTPIWFIGSLTNGNGVIDNDPWDEGTSGATASTIRSLLTRAAAGGVLISSFASPDVWILMNGTNDLDPSVGNQPPATVEATIQGEINDICGYFDPQKPWAKLALCEITQRLDGVEANVLIVNAALPGLIAASNCPSRVVLIHAHTRNGVLCVPADPAYYNAAPQHFNDLGYTSEATNCMWPELQPVFAAAHG